MAINKRSIFGYSPASVKQVIQELQEDHRLRMQGLQEELEALLAENEARRTELAWLSRSEAGQDLDSSEDRKRADTLYQMHCEQTKTIAEMKECVKQEALEQQEKLEQLQVERRKAIEEVEERILMMLKNLPGKVGLQ